MAGTTEDVAAMAAPTGPKPRLMITKLTMENFKSYYGVQQVGPFHKCFSSVVGPNGSGKSNVIDALLFVFGSRAKKIRQDKLKDLIHSSEHHLNLPNCKVAVHFQDIVDTEDGGFDVVPGTEIVVMREALRNNHSHYYLDGKKKTFKEIGALLRDKGIDLDHNRFLILQGEVEQIAMMKPKGQTDHDEGLLEYLEDIIGSDRFKDDIAVKEVRIEELNETRNEKLNRVKIVEKEKDSLESGKTEAEEYLRMDNDLSSKRSILFQCYRHECANNVAAATGQLEEFQESYNASKTDLKSSTADLTAMEQVYKKKASKVGKLQQAVDSAKADFAEFERKDIKQREDLKHAKSKTKKLEKTVTKDTNLLSETVSKLSALADDVTRMDSETKILQETVVKEEKVLDDIYESLKSETATFTKELEVKQKDLQPLSQARNDALSKAEILRSELDLLTSNARNLETQLEDSENNFAVAKQTIADRTAQVVPLESRHRQATTELTSAKKELKSLASSEEPLAAQVKSVRSKVEESKATAQEARSGSQVLEALNELQKRGKLSGFHGRLGDLGAIDDKYDCAVTTACGALNNLVVDTVAQGRRCVEFLKKNNIGRATFIILEKMDHLKARIAKPFQSPENAPRLFDLIRFKDDQFKTAFYYALRDTLVATDLEQASRIAFTGRTKNRVVSLQGQLIDTSGTMSGGGNKAARGGMSSKLREVHSPQELAALENELEHNIAQLAESRTRKSFLERQVKELTAELAAIERQLKKGAMEVHALTKQLAELEAQVMELKGRTVTVDSAQQADLEKRLAAADKILASTSASATVVEKEIEGIEKAILDIGGVQLRSQKAKVEGLNEQIATLQTSVTKAKVDSKTCKRKQTQLEKNLARANKELEDNTNSMEQIKLDLKAMEQSATLVMEAFKNASQLLEDEEESAKEMKAEYDALQEKKAQLQAAQVDLDHELALMKTTVKENVAKEKHWVKKLACLTIHKIGDDGLNESIEGEPAAGEEMPPTSSTLATLSVDDLMLADKDDLEYQITVLEDKLGQVKPNLAAISEYRKKEEEYLTRVADLDAITAERDDVRTRFEELRKERLDTFMAGFSTITMKLKEMYQMITLGGDAELELVDRLNPFSEGIVFSVRPPKKSWKNISNLSGGEKTLSSLALVFALHHFKPTPLYVMDEIDAALDFKNVSIVANYIKERTKNAQFIIISLRNNMFELADRLIGIYKTDDCTKSVTINPALVAAAAAGAQAERTKAAAPILAPTVAAQRTVATM